MLWMSQALSEEDDSSINTCHKWAQIAIITLKKAQFLFRKVWWQTELGAILQSVYASRHADELSDHARRSNPAFVLTAQAHL